MRALLLTLVASVAFADVAAAEPSDIAQSWDVLAEWVRAQNSGDFAAYSALYDDHFAGIRRSGERTVRLDRAHWLDDRARMFKKPMSVDADWISFTRNSNGVTVFFEQGFASGSYRDFGRKRIDLVRVGMKLEIAREEQLSSSKYEQSGTRPIFAPSPALLAREAARRLLTPQVDRLEVDTHDWAVTLLRKFDPVIGLRERKESADGQCTLDFSSSKGTGSPQSIGASCCPGAPCDHPSPRGSFALYLALRRDGDIAALQALAQRGLRLELSTDASTSDKVRHVKPQQIDQALVAELYPLRSFGDLVHDGEGNVEVTCDDDFSDGKSRDEGRCAATDPMGFTGHYRFRRTNGRVYLIAIDEVMEHGE